MNSRGDDWSETPGVQCEPGSTSPVAAPLDVLVRLVTCRQALESKPASLPWPADLMQALQKNPEARVREAIADWVYDPASGLEERLWRIARHRLRNHDPTDAKSVVADAVLDVIDHIEQGKPIRENLQALLIAITKFRAIDFARRRQNRLPGWSLLEGHDVTFEPERAIDADALHLAVDRLKPSSRDLIILIYFEGLTVTQAAEHLRIPDGTARSRLNRALTELRSRFREYPG
jgi:RNA polymerase sigma-70 factor (ECF subfamily)